MKTTTLAMMCLILTTISFAKAETSILTDEMALEEGMTPIHKLSNGQNDLGEIMNFARSEYVTTIPSLEDIENVIKRNKQVIVINKAATGKDAQTLRVYRDGKAHPLIENDVNDLNDTVPFSQFADTLLGELDKKLML